MTDSYSYFQCVCLLCYILYTYYMYNVSNSSSSSVSDSSDARTYQIFSLGTQKQSSEYIRDNSEITEVKR